MRLLRSVAPLGFTFAGLLAVARPLAAGGLSFDRIFEDRTRPKASGWSWRPDGRMLTCLWREGKVRELRGFDPATGKITWTLPYDGLGFPAAPAGSTDEADLASLAAGFGGPSFVWSPARDALLFTEYRDAGSLPAFSYPAK